MDSPSPPLLHEVKLSGFGAGGELFVGSARRVSWPSNHEVKLCGFGTGGCTVGRLRQEGKLVLRQEVKLWAGLEVIMEFSISSQVASQEMSGAKPRGAPHRSTSLEMPPSSPYPIHQAGMPSSPIGQARDVALLSISNPPSWSAVLSNRPGEGCVPPLHSNPPSQDAALCDQPGVRRGPPLHCKSTKPDRCPLRSARRKTWSSSPLKSTKPDRCPLRSARRKTWSSSPLKSTKPDRCPLRSARQKM